MYKKIFAMILAVNCMTTYTNESQTTYSSSEKLTIAQIENAQKALESMDKRWTPHQLAVAISIAGMTGAILTLCIGDKNPDMKNTVLNICGTAAAASTGFSILFASNEPGNHTERMKLINIIETAHKPSPKYSYV